MLRGVAGFVVLLGLAGSLSAQYGSTAVDAPARDQSEFGGGPMLALAKAARLGDDAELDRAIAELRGMVPIVEPDPRAAGRSIVTFIYRGDFDVRDVTLPELRFGVVPLARDAAANAPPASRSLETHFAHLGDTKLWYLRMNFPDDTLLGYTIACERAKQGDDPTKLPVTTRDIGPDPLNPNKMGERYVVSILRLPKAPAQNWIVARTDVPKGKLEVNELASSALGETRRFWIYTPAGYEALDDKLRVVFVFDGEWYSTELATPTVLDNLIHDAKIPPTIAVFVDGQKTRDRDLLGNEHFAAFISNELKPWVAEHYRISTKASDAVLAGSSFGGVASAAIALAFPEQFGNVLSQSGAFWPPAGCTSETPNWAILEHDSALVEKYIQSSRAALRFYLDVGFYEPSMLASNRQLRGVLLAKGYPLTYVEHPGAHNGVYWRNSIGDGLIALFGH
jgi:enterochelin esterase family protein